MRGQNETTGKHTVSLSFTLNARHDPSQPNPEYKEQSRHHELHHPPSHPERRVAPRGRSDERENPPLLLLSSPTLTHASRIASRRHHPPGKDTKGHGASRGRDSVSYKTRTACARTVVADLGLAVCASRKPNRKISVVSPRPCLIVSRVSRAVGDERPHGIVRPRRHSGFQPRDGTHHPRRSRSGFVDVPCGSASREGRRWIASRQTYSLERVRSVWGARG